MQTLLDLGHALSARRRKLGLKQGDVARQAGLAQETLSRLERGRCAEFGTRKLLAVLSVLGMELAFAESLCEHPPGTVVALARSAEGGEVRERFRTLHERPRAAREYESMPVFAAISVEGEEEPVQHPDLAAMARTRR